MNLNNQLQFFRKRSFLEIFNFSFDFFRDHFKDLTRMILMVLGPVLLVQIGVGIAYTMGMVEVGAMGSNTVDYTQQAEVAAKTGAITMVYFGVIYFVFALLHTLVTGYITIFLKEGREAITLKRLMKYTYSKVWIVIALYVMLVIIFTVTAILFLIPAIWLFVALSLASFIMLYEDVSPVDAINRSYKLVKNNWWFTFGLGLFSMVCFMVLTTMFTGVSQGLSYLLIAFSQEVGKEVTFISSLFVHVLSIFGICVQSLYIIIFAVHYGNLRERKEEKGKYLLVQSIGMSESKIAGESVEAHELA